MTGARESWAGDDFHLLWASHKCLALLEPNGQLKALSIEGPAPEDSLAVDPGGDQLLGIDIAEYLGGDTFQSAARVIHSQLKYSTRNSTEAWTAARLCEGKNGGNKGSVLHRLAQIFSAYLSKYGREAVVTRLSLKLVSNKPIHANLKRTLIQVQAVLKATPGEVSTDDLLEKLQTSAGDDVDRLVRASELASPHFSDFLRILNCDDCGVGSRHDQEEKLLRFLGNLGLEEVTSQYAQLIQLIRKRTLPDFAGSLILTCHDIVPVFGFPSIESLFPVKPRFATLKSIVTRTQAKEVARTIVEHSGGPICVHAGAGYGKTTLARSLMSHLPASSVMVVFDCYGGGSYLDPAEVRHIHNRAILQIANELAVRTGSPLLLLPEGRPEALLKALKNRLEVSVRAIREQSPDGLVVIVIDAADNSVAAAESTGQPSFVSDLIRCELPRGCRVVVTTRSHRKGQLGLPPNTAYCELRPFQPSESTEHLRAYYPLASEQQAEEFHRLSNGLPRVQGYALESSQGGIESVLEALRPDGKTVEFLIDQRIAEASRKLGGGTDAPNICRSLITLPRPIPIPYVAQLAGVDPAAVDGFCVDMWPGLRAENGFISFRDEDFETHLRLNYEADECCKEKASDLLLSNARTDAYAAIHLGDLLYSSRKLDVLRRLVLEEGLPAAVKDSLLRRDTFVKRARLALRATIGLNDRVLFLKLLLVAAEAAKTDEAVQKLVGENADLASKYGDPATVQRLFLHDKETGWYGPGHLRCAASFSRQRSTHDKAKEHLRSADGWLRWWSTLPDAERRAFAVTVEDIAAGTEAIYTLYGPEDARRWLSSWRPESTVYKAFKYVAQSFFRTGSSPDASEFWDNILKARADIALAAIEVALKERMDVPLTLLSRLTKVWRRFSRRHTGPSDALRSSGVYFIELMTKLKQDSFGLLDWFTPSPPAHISLIGDEERVSLDAFLRGQFLKAALARITIEVESLYPARLATSSKEDRKEDRRLREERERFKLAYSFLAPAYELRACCIAGTIQSDEFATKLDHCLQQYSSDYQVRHTHNGHEFIQLFVETVLDAVLHSSPNRIEHLRWIEERCAYERYRAIPLCFTLAEGTVSQPALHHKTLRYLKTVGEEIESQQISASEQVKHLVRCARIGDRIDKEAGRSYFERAISAASDIDQEAMDQLQCLARLVERIVTDNPGGRAPQSAYEFSRYVETCYWRLLGWDHFPLADSLRAVTLLDPPSGLATLCRWDENGVSDLESEIVVVLDALVARGFLDPADGCALTSLASPSDARVIKHALSFIDRMLRGGDHNRARAREALQQAVQDVFLHAPLSDRKYCCQQLNAWASQRGLGGDESAQRTQVLYAFLERMEQSHKESGKATSGGPLQVESGTKDENLVVDWDAILKGKPSWNAKVMEDAIRALPSERFGHRLIGELFERLKRDCPPAEYRTQLEAILSVDPALLPFHSLIDAIRSRSADWSVHPAVEEWTAMALPNIVEQRFQEFLAHGRFSTYYLRQLEEALGLNANSSVASIVPVLPEHVESMSAAALYQATQALVSTLPTGGAAELMEWALARVLVSVKDTIAEGPWHIDLAPPSTADEAISLLLWKLFGHPDKRIRWRAVHGVRRMVQLGSVTIIGALIGQSARESCWPFSRKTSVFYKLSARLWLFILLDRLAGEVPVLLHPHARVIIREAIQPALPHSLIRHFAKSAALRLNNGNPALFTEKQRDRLRKVLVSQFAMIEENPRKTFQRTASKSSKSEEDGRFSFDPMDTLPYWYAPLGAVFGLSQQQIAKLAEQFICDRWEYTGRVWDRDPIHNYKRYDYPLTSNNHGSEPTVEDLQTYLEYHAMFCVADQLLLKRPLVKRWESDPWKSWIQGWTLTREDSWLADGRDPTPMEEMFWGLNRRWGDKEWKRNIPAYHFDTAIGLTNPLLPGFLVLDASIERRDGKDYESIHIASALVSPATAHALLRALHTAKEPFNYGIPREGGELEIKDDLGFELRGWIQHLHSDYGGIDETDPLRNEIDKGRRTVGNEFAKWARLQISRDYRTSYSRKKPKQLITMFEHWDDFPSRSRDYAFGSSGSRLWVRKSSLLEFLKAKKWCLIIKCSVDRHLDSLEEDLSVPSEKAKVVLIYENGNIETLS